MREWRCHFFCPDTDSDAWSTQFKIYNWRIEWHHSSRYNKIGHTYWLHFNYKREKQINKRLKKRKINEVWDKVADCIMSHYSFITAITKNQYFQGIFDIWWILVPTYRMGSIPGLFISLLLQWWTVPRKRQRSWRFHDPAHWAPHGLLQVCFGSEQLKPCSPVVLQEQD